MRKKSKTSVEIRSKHYQRMVWKAFPHYEHDCISYRRWREGWVPSYPSYPKRKRYDYGYKDYNFTNEHNCPKWWRQLHEEKYRARTRQWLRTKLDCEGYEYVGVPHHRKPWNYFW